MFENVDGQSLMDLKVLSILMHGIISLQDATSYDKHFFHDYLN